MITIRSAALRAALFSLAALSNGCATAPAASTTPAQKPAGARFDPSRAAVGDVVAGLRIRRLEVHPALAERREWVGSVWFEGPVTVSGTYRPHFDYPETKLLCFYPDPASAARLPRFASDERVSWFCFRNQEDAVSRLAPPPASGPATVTINDFGYHYSHSDVFNEAQLARVEPPPKQPRND